MLLSLLLRSVVVCSVCVSRRFRAVRSRGSIAFDVKMAMQSVEISILRADELFGSGVSCVVCLHVLSRRICKLGRYGDIEYKNVSITVFVFMNPEVIPVRYVLYRRPAGAKPKGSVHFTNSRGRHNMNTNAIVRASYATVKYSRVKKSRSHFVPYVGCKYRYR
jgi:hypothetical protein